MKLSRVAPELRGPLLRSPEIPVRLPWALRFTRFLMHRMDARHLPGVTLELPEEAAPGVRVYRPEERRSDAALLWIHGGGLVIGRAAQDDPLCNATALELGVTVVSAEYRLAPEHPYPVALNDCHAAWAWLLENAGSLGVDPSRVAVGGQSAGGGLAAALVQRLHDEGGTRPVAQWLLSPMLDDRTAARRDLDKVGHYMWNNKANRFGWRSYLATAPGSSAVPGYAVPARREDLSGLPPAWIGVGDIDLFHEESREYGRRLREAGVDAAFHSVPGAPHGFESWAPGTGIAGDYLATARAWLGRALAQGPDGPGLRTCARSADSPDGEHRRHEE
ncbi:acetyl esterase/lipase [Nocardiopsis arvandica]|uniref:Acetyl esterase/lipase n=1 Tax=Nocardiopsis sinuspersici TaxID=501010 RepID=A0A7Z0BHJ5_9ACTN|nr:alpha/beta hydrolase [Nocardiopsis sinuspersici]NYH51076.1 acetyl esterase/lipase [Nocardiopsis sinuspersici]